MFQNIVGYKEKSQRGSSNKCVLRAQEKDAGTAARCGVEGQDEDQMCCSLAGSRMQGQRPEVVLTDRCRGAVGWRRTPAWVNQRPAGIAVAGLGQGI